MLKNEAAVAVGISSGPVDLENGISSGPIAIFGEIDLKSVVSSGELVLSSSEICISISCPLGVWGGNCQFCSAAAASAC